MIAKLTGVVDSTGDGWTILDVSGVGYRVFCSARTLGRLGPGEAASLLIETHMREDHIHLYGFIDEAERDWFRLLTTVQGVGAKVGLAILSALGSGDLARALASGDRPAITRANGVGAKLATRILSELKDKVGGIALAPAAGMDGAGAVGDAASALVNLGYGASEALGAVSQAAVKIGADADTKALIRAGLAELAPGDGAR
jgi:Holliday junction DNA helicase RuvA